jgi:peroxiredoxin
MTWLSNLLGGKKDMQALSAGTRAPQFELPTMNGANFSLQDALARGPVLAVFLKVSCPVCQYALPFFQRLYKAHGGKNVSIIAISQNEKNDTAMFLQKYGLSMPVLLDDTKSFSVSNAYGLTNVPTAFWIAGDGSIEISSVGWSRADFEQIARKLVESTHGTPTSIFQPAEQIADFRAG